MRPSLALTAIAGAVIFASPVDAQTVSPAAEPAVAAVVAGTTSAPAVMAPAAEAPATASKDLKSETSGEAAEPAKPKPLPPSLIAKINLATQRMEVVVDGQSKHTWAVSSGRSGYASPRGTYRVNWTAKMWYSRKYDMAPMPHAVFFTGGVAIHATNAVGMLGRPASHGCIRLAPANAAAFYALVQKHGNARTQVQVFGSSPSEQIAERRPRTQVAERAPERDRERVAQRRDRPAPTRVSAGQSPHFFAPGSPYYGRPAYVQNGVIYVKVR